MYYKKCFNRLNISIKILVKLNNKFYILKIKIYYRNLYNKIKFYFKYTTYYNKNL